MFILRNLYLVILFFITCSFSLKNDPLTNPQEHTKVEKGHVIYSYGSGKMQCQSQVDRNGKIVVLLKPLEENTKVSFIKVSKKDQRYLLTSMMSVKEETELCASWVNNQEVNIFISPIQVEEITLTGNLVHISKEIIVLLAEGRQS